MIGFFYSIFLIGCAHAMSNSKLSIHTSMGTNSWDIVNNGKPRLIKLLDSFGDAANIKAAVPGIVIIGRIYLADQPSDGDPKELAQKWWDTCSGQIKSAPSVDFWEGYNEPGVGDDDAMKWLAAFEVARTEILAQNGFKSIVGSFSTGTPDVNNPQIIKEFYPALDAAIKYNGILGIHEYSSPYMNGSYEGDPIHGEGWLTGRYRKLYNQFLIPDNKTLPVAVTENGIDGGTCGVNKCNIGGGWKNFCSYWQDTLHIDDCNAEYMNQLAWYDQVMRADDYVIGSTIFTLEISGWDDFDIGPITPNMVDYLKSQ